MLAAVYQSAIEQGASKASASAQAWGVVRRHFYKRGGKWHAYKRPRKANPPEAAGGAPAVHNNESPSRTVHKTHSSGRPNPSIAGSRSRKGAPLPARAVRETSEHGRVLDLVVRGADGQTRRLRFPARPLLQWSPEADALLWWEGASMGRARAVNRSDLPAKSRRVWERFHDADAGTLREATVPDDLGAWLDVGQAVAIGYRNPQRWGADDAEHDFGRGVRVYRARTRKPFLWVVRGGRLRMTPHGIEG